MVECFGGEYQAYAAFLKKIVPFAVARRLLQSADMGSEMVPDETEVFDDERALFFVQVIQFVQTSHRICPLSELVSPTTLMYPNICLT